MEVYSQDEIERKSNTKIFMSAFFRMLGISILVSYVFWVYESNLKGSINFAPEIGLIIGFVVPALGPGLVVFLLLSMIFQRLRVALLGFHIITYSILALVILGAAAEFGLISV